MEQKKSAVVTLIDHVYQHTNEAKGRSWSLLNEALYTSLQMAIKSQFKFEQDDFSNLRSFSYWCGYDGNMSGERFYSAAIEYSNRSAAIAFETFKGRKPFMLNGKRLAVNSEFQFSKMPVSCETDNEIFRLWVTSITNESIIACWYDNKGQLQKGNPARRFTFTQSELKTAQKEGRAAMEVEDFKKWLQSK